MQPFQQGPCQYKFMKKIITLLIILSCSALTSGSFAQIHEPDRNVGVAVGAVTLNFGIGGGVNYRDYFTNRIAGVKTVLEFGVWHAGPGVITLGGESGLSFSDGNRGGFTFISAARSAWHCGWNIRRLDLYGGFSVGAGLLHSDDKVYRIEGNNYDDQVIPVLGAFAGASYFVSRRFGFNAEAGTDITHFQFGLVFKLK
jgi:hypothetical protein